jgi:hypothetical protein
MNSGQLLYQGIRAFKTGRMDEARKLWELVVAQDEENETAWLGLSSVLEDTAQRRICLENVLFLNPDNEVAKERLALLPPREGKTASWLWRWLFRKSGAGERDWPYQIQPLKPEKNVTGKKGTDKEGAANWQALHTHVLLAGAMGIALLTALLMVVI